MSQLSGMILVLAMMQLVKYFDLGNAKYTTLIRAIYAVVQLIMFGALFYLRTLIFKRRLQDQVTVPRVPNPFTDTGNEPTEETLTVQEYDLREWRKIAQSQVMGTVLLVVIHAWFKNLQPLIFQSVIPLKTLFTHQLFKIYIMGVSAEGKLARPWKESSALSELFGGANRTEEAAEQTEEPRIVELDSDAEEQEKKEKKSQNAQKIKADLDLPKGGKKSPVLSSNDDNEQEEALLKQRRKPARKADD
jgi:hypothetical protein